jgi:hypothetical protein
MATHRINGVSASGTTMTQAAIPQHSIPREAYAAAGIAAALAAALAWFGPPGSDFAAHLYQSGLFEAHGFAIWNNFWYAGRYSFVNYSLLYYPLAAWLGIRLLAVASIATAALAFAVVGTREWGPAARWSNRSFAVVWAATVLSGAFPFALGFALALLALWALQAGRRWWFALLTVLALASSPVAFVLLVVVMAGIGLARTPRGGELALPLATLVVATTVELLLWRLFPAGGRFPFSLPEFAAACIFCGMGILLTWHVRTAGVLRWTYVVYLVACTAAYLVPSGLGENIARLRFAAIPIAILTLSLRRWRPLPIAMLAITLAFLWNVTPLAASYMKTKGDRAADPAYWHAATGFLLAHLSPSYRVEAVDTAGHWPAAYLPAAGIPIARGWFRQDDFPRNGVLYSKLDRPRYVAWLRSLGVRYVVLPDVPLDYSAREEGALLASGRSGLRIAFRSAHTTIYAVPSPRRIVTGPGRPRVVKMGQHRIVLAVTQPGRYRVATNWSPYWSTTLGCLSKGSDGTIRLTTPRPGAVRLDLSVDATSALAALEGASKRRCAD